MQRIFLPRRIIGRPHGSHLDLIMALISLQEISLAFGGPLIFDCLSLQLESGERVALLGRNGAEKLL
jgi:ABC-type molybdenum transport system ATPase subunit/photorepair protein PhrA